MTRLFLPSRRRASHGFLPLLPTAEPAGDPGDTGDGSGDPVDPNAIYVATTGSDTTGDGSSGNPYRSLTKAATDITVGGTIYLRGGTYNTIGADVYYTNLVATDTISDLDLRGKASEANRLTIRSYPGESAILDGSNHSWYPRTAGDGNSVAYAYMMRLIGEYVDLKYLEIKNGVGAGIALIGNNNTIQHVTCHHNHSDGIYIQGSYNWILDYDGHHNYSIENGGNTADAIKMVDNGSQAEAFFGAGARTIGNTIRRCRAWLNSDDGFDLWSAEDTLIEYCLAANNGYDSTGNGEGFKMGPAGGTEKNNTARYCIAVNNKSDGIIANFSTGHTFEWCTVYDHAGMINFDHRPQSGIATDGSEGSTLSRNNISYEAQYPRSPATDRPRFCESRPVQP